jgi:hypothetical protein
MPYEELLAILMGALYVAAPIGAVIGGALTVHRKRKKMRALEAALGPDIDVVPTDGAVMAFRARRGGRIMEARALVGHKKQAWFVTSTRKAALGPRHPSTVGLIPVDTHDRRVDDTMRIAASDPTALRAWLAREDVADDLRASIARGDVLRAEVERDGDAMLRVRFRGAEAVHILDLIADVSAFHALLDRHPDQIKNVAFQIVGGEAVEVVEDAVGGASGVPFGISTSDRK